MKPYEPELGQAIFGAPTGEFDLPEFAEALFFHIWGEIDRLYWNANQKKFEHRGERLDWDKVQVRPYYWGDDDAESEKPNFTFGGVEIRWYKYPGRGMSCNVDMDEKQWRKWMDECLTYLRKEREVKL